MMTAAESIVDSNNAGSFRSNNHNNDHVTITTAAAAAETVAVAADPSPPPSPPSQTNTPSPPTTEEDEIQVSMIDPDEEEEEEQELTTVFPDEVVEEQEEDSQESEDPLMGLEEEETEDLMVEESAYSFCRGIFLEIVSRVVESRSRHNGDEEEEEESLDMEVFQENGHSSVAKMIAGKKSSELSPIVIVPQIRKREWSNVDSSSSSSTSSSSQQQPKRRRSKNSYWTQDFDYSVKSNDDDGGDGSTDDNQPLAAAARPRGRRQKSASGGKDRRNKTAAVDSDPEIVILEELFRCSLCHQNLPEAERCSKRRREVMCWKCYKSKVPWIRLDANVVHRVIVKETKRATVSLDRGQVYRWEKKRIERLVVESEEEEEEDPGTPSPSRMVDLASDSSPMTNSEENDVSSSSSSSSLDNKSSAVTSGGIGATRPPPAKRRSKKVKKAVKDYSVSDNSKDDLRPPEVVKPRNVVVIKLGGSSSVEIEEKLISKVGGGGGEVNKKSGEATKPKETEAEKRDGEDLVYVCLLCEKKHPGPDATAAASVAVEEYPDVGQLRRHLEGTTHFYSILRRGLNARLSQEQECPECKQIVKRDELFAHVVDVHRRDHEVLTLEDGMDLDVERFKCPDCRDSDDVQTFDNFDSLFAHNTQDHVKALDDILQSSGVESILVPRKRKVTTTTAETKSLTPPPEKKGLSLREYRRKPSSAAKQPGESLLLPRSDRDDSAKQNGAVNDVAIRNILAEIKQLHGKKKDEPPPTSSVVRKQLFNPVVVPAPAFSSTGRRTASAAPAKITYPWDMTDNDFLAWFQETVTCELCGFVTDGASSSSKNKKPLLQHLFTEHFADELQALLRTRQRQRNKPVGPPFVCPMAPKCSLVKDSLYALASHYGTVHNRVLPLYQNTLKRANAEVDGNVNNGGHPPVVQEETEEEKEKRRIKEELQRWSAGEDCGKSFLQTYACYQVGSDVLVHCHECDKVRYRTAEESSSVCQFEGFRKIRFDPERRGFVAAGFLDPFADPSQLDIDLWELPRSADEARDGREPGPEQSEFILRHVGDEFCHIASQEAETARQYVDEKGRAVIWKRMQEHAREMCDVCSTSLFNLHYSCEHCCTLVCLDCFVARRNNNNFGGGSSEEDQKMFLSPSRRKKRRERKDLDDHLWPLCSSMGGKGHVPGDLLLTQIICGDSLERMKDRLHEARRKSGMTLTCKCGVSEEEKVVDIETEGVSMDERATSSVAAIAAPANAVDDVFADYKKCHICSTEFSVSNLNLTLLHMTRHYADAIVSKKNIPTVDNGILKCDECPDFETDNAMTLVLHYGIAHRHTHEMARAEMRKETTTKNIVLNIDKDRKCRVCGQDFQKHMMGFPEVRQHYYSQHFRKDMAKLLKQPAVPEGCEIPCPDCGLKFRQKSHLLSKHLAVFHRYLDKFACGGNEEEKVVEAGEAAVSSESKKYFCVAIREQKEKVQLFRKTLSPVPPPSLLDKGEETAARSSTSSKPKKPLFLEAESSLPLQTRRSEKRSSTSSPTKGASRPSASENKSLSTSSPSSSSPAIKTKARPQEETPPAPEVTKSPAVLGSDKENEEGRSPTKVTSPNDSSSCPVMKKKLNLNDYKMRCAERLKSPDVAAAAAATKTTVATTGGSDNNKLVNLAVVVVGSSSASSSSVHTKPCPICSDWVEKEALDKHCVTHFVPELSRTTEKSRWKSRCLECDQDNSSFVAKSRLDLLEHLGIRHGMLRFMLKSKTLVEEKNYVYGLRAKKERKEQEVAARPHEFMCPMEECGEVIKTDRLDHLALHFWLRINQLRREEKEKEQRRHHRQRQHCDICGEETPNYFRHLSDRHFDVVLGDFLPTADLVRTREEMLGLEERMRLVLADRWCFLCERAENELQSHLVAHLRATWVQEWDGGDARKKCKVCREWTDEDDDAEGHFLRAHGREKLDSVLQVQKLFSQVRKCRASCKVVLLTAETRRAAEQVAAMMNGGGEMYSHHAPPPIKEEIKTEPMEDYENDMYSSSVEVTVKQEREDSDLVSSLQEETAAVPTLEKTEQEETETEAKALAEVIPAEAVPAETVPAAVVPAAVVSTESVPAAVLPTAEVAPADVDSVPSQVPTSTRTSGRRRQSFQGPGYYKSLENGTVLESVTEKTVVNCQKKPQAKEADVSKTTTNNNKKRSISKEEEGNRKKKKKRKDPSPSPPPKEHCEFCNEGYLDDDFYSHMALVHLREAFAPFFVLPSHDPPYQCPRCVFVADDEDEMIVHLAEYHRIVDQILNEDCRDEVMNPDQQPRTTQNLVSCERVSPDLPVYTCEVCNNFSSFSATKVHLHAVAHAKSHLSSVVAKDGPFVCPKCFRESSTYFSLLRHFSLSHGALMRTSSKSFLARRTVSLGSLEEQQDDSLTGVHVRVDYYKKEQRRHVVANREQSCAKDDFAEMAKAMMLLEKDVEEEEDEEMGKVIDAALGAFVGGGDPTTTMLTTTNVQRVWFNTHSRSMYPDVGHEWLCDGKLLILEDPRVEMNMPIFQEQWRRGQPIMIANSSSHLNQDLWTPQSFLRDFGHLRHDLINCLNGSVVPNAKLEDFWRGFEEVGKRLLGANKRPMLLKLKDWPPTDDIADYMPERFDDLLRAFPMPDYTLRDGKYNLASFLPDYFLKPELGPKMYIAYGSALYPDKGSTNLHIDMSDAVNCLVHVGLPRDSNREENEREVYKEIDKAGCDVLMKKRARRAAADNRLPGALWHIFHPRDTDKIRDLLKHVAFEKGKRLDPHDDPIHDQSTYLDGPLRMRLYGEYGVQGYAIVQNMGDTVFIPAGAAHQVRNLHNCIKVAEDFVSPENVSHCLHLTQEFRHLTEWHTNHEDKLQIKNIIYHSIKRALATLLL